MLKPAIRVGALFALLILLPLPVSAQSARAEVPYALMHQALQPVRDLESHPLLRAVPRVRSRHAEIAPETIELSILATAGTLHLSPSPGGELLLPDDAQLLQENPVVTSNQPRGSLHLSVDVALRHPPSTSLDMAWLLQALDAAELVLAEASGQQQRVSGAEFWFDGQATATVASAAGEQLLMSGREQRIIVLREQPSDARIELSRVPQLVLPFVLEAPP